LNSQSYLRSNLSKGTNEALMQLVNVKYYK